MNIKILETKLQTIFENDLFIVTEDNIIERLLMELDFINNRIAEYCETLDMITTIRLGAKDKITDVSCDFDDLTNIILKCDQIIDMLENESFWYKEKIIGFAEELFTNQELYDLLKDNMPTITKLVDKFTLENSNLSLDRFLDWFGDEIDYIKIEDIEKINAYQFIDKLCYEYNEFFEPDTDLRLVKNEKGGAKDEGTGSN